MFCDKQWICTLTYPPSRRTFVTVIVRSLVVVVCGSVRCCSKCCRDRMSLRRIKKNAHDAQRLLVIYFSVRLCLYWHGGKRGRSDEQKSPIRSDNSWAYLGILSAGVQVGGRIKELGKHRLILPWINLPAFSKL